uniref:Uncharacterized protein n=1 Tax=Anguilla anguilla TaxID=7936 RepID=A0A0E9U150_ANGAN
MKRYFLPSQISSIFVIFVILRGFRSLNKM